MPIIEYQRGSAPCPNADCRRARRLVDFEISSSGPWAIKEKIVKCDGCKTIYEVKIDLDATNTAKVSLVRLMEPIGFDLCAWPHDDNMPRDLYIQCPIARCRPPISGNPPRFCSQGCMQNHVRSEAHSGD